MAGKQSAIDENVTRLQRLVGASALSRALRDGASGSALREIAEIAGAELPPAFVALYRWSDGLSGEAELFPGWHWMPLERVRDDHAMLLKSSDEIGAEDLAGFLPSYLPFCADGGGNYLCLDVATGRVLDWDHEDIPRLYLPDVDALLTTAIAVAETPSLADEEDDEAFSALFARLNPGYPQALDPIRRLHERIDDPETTLEECISLAREGLLSEPRDEGFYASLYHALGKLGRHEELLDVIEAWRTLFPGYLSNASKQASFRKRRIDALLGLGRHDELIAEANDLLANFSKDQSVFPSAESLAELRTQLAEVLATEGRAAEAVAEYKRAAEECFRANHDAAMYWREYANHQPDPDEKAAALHKVVAILDKWLAKNGKDADSFYERACARALLGQAEAARDDLASAIELAPDNRDVARDDEDFAVLRDDPAFARLVEDER